MADIKAVLVDVPMPEPLLRVPAFAGRPESCFTAAQMRAFGEACARAALESLGVPASPSSCPSQATPIPHAGEVRSGRQPIETAPIGKGMFVVRAFNVSNGFTGWRPYTTDPWCVWQATAGEFSRWPHHFAPTHWAPLPAAPEGDTP